MFGDKTQVSRGQQKRYERISDFTNRINLRNFVRLMWADITIIWLPSSTGDCAFVSSLHTVRMSQNSNFWWQLSALNNSHCYVCNFALNSSHFAQTPLRIYFQTQEETTHEKAFNWRYRDSSDAKKVWYFHDHWIWLRSDLDKINEWYTKK